MKKYILLIGILLPTVLMAQLTAEFNINGEEISFNQWGNYDKVMFGDQFLNEIGKPELPFVTKSFVIPNNVSVSELQIQVTNERKLSGSYYIYPAQPPQTVNETEPIPFVEPDASVYNSLSAYPKDTAIIASDGIIQGYHVVTIAYYPIIYIPGNRELYIRDLSVILNYRTSFTATTSPNISYNRALLAKGYVKAMVENPEDVDRYADNSNVIPQKVSLNKGQSAANTRGINIMEEIIPDYIIITRDSLKDTYKKLADWKTKTGIPTLIKTLEEIEVDYRGSDLPEKIRNYLLDVKKRWNGNSMFVLLGGDTDVVPARLAYGSYEHSNYTADIYYVADKVSWNPSTYNLSSNSEIAFQSSSYIGRIPLKTITETSTFINKLLAYEKANDKNVDYSYFKNSLIIHAYLDGPHSTNAYMNEFVNYCKNRDNNYWYMFDHFKCTSTDDHAYKQTYDYSDATKGEELNKNNFLSALQNGRDYGQFHFIYHLDHSWQSHLGASAKTKGMYVFNKDIDNLPDTSYPKVILSSGCHPGRVDKDCIAEHLLKKTHGGAIAFLGNTDVGWGNEYIQLREFLNVAFNKTLFSKEQYSLGYIHSKVINIYHLINWSDDDCWRLHLLGDPTTLMWTSTPKNLQVTVTPNSINSGENEITVTVKNLPTGQQATICLMKDEEAYATRVVSNATPQKFTFAPNTSGTLNVTVTAHNFRPFETTIPVKANENRAVYIQNLIFDDDRDGNSIGDGDGHLDAGETIELTIDMKNGGSTVLNNAKGTLSCSSPYITLLNSATEFGKISTTETVRSKSKFRFRIDKNTPEIRKSDFDAIEFTLKITDGTEPINTNTFKIDVEAPELELRDQSILNNGSDRYLFIDLMNVGKGSATGLIAQLSSDHSSIQAIQSQPSSYPVIDRNEVKGNTQGFLFRINPAGQMDTNVYFTLTVSNEYGKTWTFNQFKPLERGKQIAVNKIAATSSYTTIELNWTKEISTSYNIYRSINEKSGNYVKLNTYPLTSSYFQDMDVTPFATYYYKIAGISKSGNQGPLSEAVKGMPSFPFVESFPRIMDSECESMSSVNVADINYDGYQEIFLTTTTRSDRKGRLIGLTHKGEELLNPNPLAVHGIGTFPTRVVGIPAIGDIKGNGEQAVLLPTWDNATLEHNVLTCFSMKDTDGDNMLDQYWQNSTGISCYRGSILANLDNSADGSLEIIQKSDKPSKLSIFDNNGKLKYDLGIGNPYSMPAIADLDGDGDKEIIATDSIQGILIYHHDGTIFGTGNPLWGRGMKLLSSPVVCDLNNDGQKEIIVVGKNGTDGCIYVVNLKGKLVDKWNGSQKVYYRDASKKTGFEFNVSVGDINGDGYLEVVAIGTNYIKAWSHTGENIFEKQINYFFSAEGWRVSTDAPILADVDGDGIADIIFTNFDKIDALHGDGTHVLGFPLEMNSVPKGIVCASDIDHDEKTEIITIDNNNSNVYVWKTNGNPNAIEWGSERHDSHNTGEYGTFCQPKLIRSSTVWDGVTPCGNIIVQSGTFTIPAGKTMSLDKTSKIIIRSGGVLVVDGSTINNAYIWAQDGGQIILKNNATINLRSSGNFIIDKKAILDNQYSVINKSTN